MTRSPQHDCKPTHSCEPPFQLALTRERGGSLSGANHQLVTVSCSGGRIAFIMRITLISSFLTTPAFAQKLVDPSTVAPAYRQAAEIRRAEQIKQRESMHKADLEKVMPRDRTAYLNHCLEADAGK